MREVISVNGTFPRGRAASPLFRLEHKPVNEFPLTPISIVGQAGCQIANSCWEVSFDSISLCSILLGYINAETNKDFCTIAVLPRTRYSGE